MKGIPTIMISIAPFGNAVSDYYLELAKCFVKKKYKVVIIFYNKPQIEEKEENNIIYYVWPSKRPVNFKDFFFFVRLLVKYKPSMVFSNFSSTNIIGIASIFFRIKKRYNYLHTTPTQLKLDSTQSIYKQHFLKYRKHLIYKLYNYFLTNSEGTKQGFIEYFKIPKHKVFVLPLLIENSKFLYVPKKVRKKQIIILGRLVKSKGHLELLNCFKLLVEKDNEYRLLIAGQGDQIEVLKEFVLNNNLSENILLLGRIPYHEIGKYISESLIHVSASYAEAFGLVNIESLREGTPILCTVTDGSKDILVPNYNGEFFDSKEPITFVEKVKQIEDNWDFYSNNAKESFNNNYSIDAVEKHYDKLI